MAKRTGDIELAGEITTPDGEAAGDSGQDFVISAGAGLTTGDGGDITLTPGAAPGAGSPGAIVISQTTAPTVTTDKLYNDGGALTWNGTNISAGGGDVSKVGTPVNDQLGIWTGDGTLEGDSRLTWDTGSGFFNIDDLVPRVRNPSGLLTLIDSNASTVTQGTPQIHFHYGAGNGIQLGRIRYDSADMQLLNFVEQITLWPAFSSGTEIVEIQQGGLQFNERADHATAPIAAKGEVWLKNDSPNTLMFTDDTGTDYDLTIGAVGGSNTEIQYNNNGVLDGILGFYYTPGQQKILAQSASAPSGHWFEINSNNLSGANHVLKVRSSATFTGSILHLEHANGGNNANVLTMNTQNESGSQFVLQKDGTDAYILDALGYNTLYPGTPADGEVLTWNTSNGRAEFTAAGGGAVDGYIAPVKYATTVDLDSVGNGTWVPTATTLTAGVNGTTTLDGNVVANGDRVLVKDQTAPAENGLFVVSGDGVGELTVLTRTADFDEASEMISGSLVAVQEGTVNLDSLWMMTQDAAITVGTTSITWRDITGVAAFTENTDNSISSAGAGASLSSGGTYNFLALDGAGNDLTTGDHNIFIGNDAGASMLAASGNIGIGQDAMTNGFGTDNVVIGNFAGDKMTNDGFNVVIGGSAGRSLTSGATYNIVLGHSAMGLAATSSFGDNNIAIGRNALRAASLVDNGIALGINALLLCSSGDSNVAIGSGGGTGVLGKITTGVSNIGIGTVAGTFWTAGATKNIAIGANAGPTGDVDEDNKLYIHNAAGTPFIGGDMGTGEFQIAGTMRFTERSDHIGTPTATFGELWVRDDGPNKLIFTDDAGTDFDLTASGIADVVDDTSPQLGGNLDVNGNDIVSVSNGDIDIIPNGTGKTKITNIEAPLTINTQTGTTYGPVLADAEKMITLDNASAITVTIPANSGVAYPVGTKLNFMQLGAGQVTVAITTDTLNVESTLTLLLAGQYAAATAFKVTSTSWVLFGNLEAA